MGPSGGRAHVSDRLAADGARPCNANAQVEGQAPSGDRPNTAREAIFDALYPKVQELDQLLLSGLSHEERGMLEHMFVKLEDRVESWMNDIELPKANHRRVALPTRANSLENAAGEQHQAERSACKP